MNPFPVLETEHLLLRRLEMSDAERVQLLANEHDVADKITLMPYPYSLQDAHDWITITQADMDMNANYTFAIVLKSEQQFIGAIEVGNEFRHKRGELGYWIGKPYWGQGYMTEAAGRMLQFAFETLGLNRVSSSHYPKNPASGRVMQKIGMSSEGTLRGHVLKWDKPVDLCVYSILQEEWVERVVSS